MRDNQKPNLRLTLQQGNSIANAWMTIGDPYLAEIVSGSDAFDTVTFDMQHGLIDQRAAIDCIRAVHGQGVCALVRLPRLDESLIGLLLDAAVDGLILPQVNSQREAAQFVSACHYPPSGTRSFGPTRSGLRTGSENDAFIIFAMIETLAGLESARQIAAVEGLHGVFIGPGDLGISLGIGAGQDRCEPEYIQAVGQIRQAAKLASKALGIHANSAEYAAEKVREGFQLVTTWVDVVGVKQSIGMVSNLWKQTLPGNPIR